MSHLKLANDYIIYTLYIFGLLFINTEDISNGFVDDLMNERPIDERLQKCFDYFVKTNSIDHYYYPPKLWSIASSKLTRTTDACESNHAHFKNSFIDIRHLFYNE
uniref:Uncharacterized protein n=1 Tax=Sipha flava TaxID=143950 RepID=A0A2S2QRU6_9HEMI